jgi:hypothetical protein
MSPEHADPPTVERNLVATEAWKVAPGMVMNDPV